MDSHDVELSSWGLLNQTRSNHKDFNSFLSALSQVGELVLFGGAIRDAYVYGESAKPRDFDFVVSGPHADLDHLLRSGCWAYSMNRFGGYKVHLGEVVADVWSLSSTWAFRERIVRDVEVATLPRTVFLNVDSVALSLTTRELVESGFCDAVRHKVLDIVLESNPLPSLNVLRALRLKSELGFRFSDRLKDYVHAWLLNHNDPYHELSTLEESRYKVRSLTQDVILDALAD